MPGLPLRSVSAPRELMMSVMTALIASSDAASTGMMPSPLKFVCEKIFVVSAVSSTVISVAFFLPRSERICRADDNNVLPSGVASLIAVKGRAGDDINRSSGFFRQLAAHFAAAMISGARIRPSLSVSTRSSVLVSNSIPRVGQASATHSFWSSSSRWATSAPRSNFTWSNPPARKKRHLYELVIAMDPVLLRRHFLPNHRPKRNSPSCTSLRINAYGCKFGQCPNWGGAV